MDNNDILIRLRYALDIKDTEMVEIFKIGGIELTIEKVRKMLIKAKDSCNLEDEVQDEIEENIICTNSELESFLNGFIIFKRGLQDQEPGQSEKPVLAIKNNQNVNNIMLKKLKIALSLTSEDMLDIFNDSGLNVTKGELSALFRKEGHKHYKECGDKYARNFLKGLALKNRK
ncbi:hypothetical protein CLNEO_24830 [Anaerotignum neopropionicum]|uniref:Cytoplasmic protein n=1 Tax=Anaerotignum neopropionicum TaxID=36847 RepID=A0A136WCA7_9FIRM|nr:DUF1456 family protein [Anaerotignum neopropionicum]KXL52134.1 hypothetical protein CLNEO_24830 [Anaerotignum neopropionicum]